MLQKTCSLTILAAVCFAGCGGPSSTPAGSAGSMPGAAAGASTRERAQEQNLVYVSDYALSAVLAFPAGLNQKNPPPVETISLPAPPAGLWVDRNGVLYVADDSSVLEYKPGSTSPFLTITSGVTAASSVVVDSAGTLYVGNHSGSDVTVVEYAAGSTVPRRTLTLASKGSLFGFAGGMTFDSDANLYVAALFYPQTNGHVFRFKPGASRGADLGLAMVGESDGLACDTSGNLYVGDTNDAGLILVYHLGERKPFEAITATSDYPSFFALTRDGSLYVPSTAGSPSNSSLLEFAPGSRSSSNALRGYLQAPVGAALQSAAY